MCWIFWLLFWCDIYYKIYIYISNDLQSLNLLLHKSTFNEPRNSIKNNNKIEWKSKYLSLKLDINLNKKSNQPKKLS
jgi:hypothetical protein